jgi:TPR repeat protein
MSPRGLGDRLLRGDDGSPAPKAAAERYRDACDAQLPEACLRLARQHETGDGVRFDPGAAQRLRSRACAMGAAAACEVADRSD